MTWLSDMVDGIKRLGRKKDYLDDLVKEATNWVGLKEKKGSPSSIINVFRRANDGVAEGEPWCAAFVQYCVSSVANRNNLEISLAASELCYNLWHNTPKRCRLKGPVPGSIIIWNYPGTQRGHTGIVHSVMPDGLINTIEGNTGDPREGADKSFRGVFPKIRSSKGSEGMVVLGYINPFL